MLMNDVCENEVTIGGDLQVGTFSIKESAKAFQILSSSLYRYKIRAIIRELACNARDSRIAAELTEDFYVHLPTKMEPEFWIKDEGTGLSHVEVMTLYTTYFESTKTNSNAFVGALGLGSKSPFSYTENFTVTAIKDGTRGVYSAFINETGVPSIVCMFSGPTEEPNGVEVRIPVAQKDHYEFLQEAGNVFRWFTVRPECNLSYASRAQETKHEYYTEVQSGTKSVVLMGGVAYEFEMSEFIVGSYNRIKFLFRMEIGEVDMLPSREGLQNTAKTKSAILGTYNRIIDLEQSKIAKKLDEIDTVYEKISYLNDMPTNMERHIKNLLKESKFPNDKSIVAFNKLEQINLKCSYYSSASGHKTPKNHATGAITPSPYNKFIYNDGGYPISLIKDQFRYSCSAVFVFSKADNKLAADFEAFRVKNLLGATVTIASSFVVKPTRTVSSTYTSKRNNVGVMYASMKSTKNWYHGDQYRLLLKDTSDMRHVKYFVRLDVAKCVTHKGVNVTIDSITKFVGSETIVFLKHDSKFDTTGLTEVFDYVDSSIPMRSTYTFNMGYNGYKGLTSLITCIDRHKLNISDPVLVEIVNEFMAFAKSNVFTKLEKFTEQHTTLYVDTRKPYDTATLDMIQIKYDILDAETCRKPALIEKLINIIHHESKV